MSDLNLPVLLRTLRKAHRITQHQMAERMKAHERTYREWERGTTPPSVYHLHELAKSFDRNLADLLQVDLHTGEFPALTPSEKEGEVDRIMVALLHEPSIPRAIKNLILRIIKRTLSAG